MQYRKMGSLDWEVSALGFGCMRLPSRKFSLMGADKEESKRIIRYGIDRGINYIDTAWPYHLGESEKIVGESLQDGYRERVKLVTKLPMFLVYRTSDFDRFLDVQLDRLQTDHIDIYLFHALNKKTFERVKQLGLIEKMEQAKRQGRIHHIGFSFHDTFPVFKEIIDYYDWDMAQIQYNYMDTCVQATTEVADPPREAAAVMEGAEIERKPVDWALQFLWNRPEVSTVLSGMSNFRQVMENCDSADVSGVGTLSKEENQIINQLAEIYQQKILVPCTGCEYCLPCPQGVNIPQNFALLNNLSLETGWRRRFQARRSFRKMASKADQLTPERPNGSALLCINCGECLEKCPQEIAIPLELERVEAILGRREDIKAHY
ncbi:MAG: aldo/keto reductase [Anaerolineales bacterium]